MNKENLRTICRLCGKSEHYNLSVFCNSKRLHNYLYGNNFNDLWDFLINFFICYDCNHTLSSANTEALRILEVKIKLGLL